MKQIEDLQRRWEDSARSRGLHAAMSLEKHGVMLGAGTLLARRHSDGRLTLEGEDSTVLTLLSIACGRPVDPSILEKFRRASECARGGNEAAAAMHIVLALPVLRDPDDAARRLFIADGLMKEGVDPRDIWNALDFDPAPLDELEKFYNPDQPRVPAGNGPTSGQWTSESTNSDAELPATIAARVAAGDAAETAAETAEGVATRERWQWLLEIGARAAGPLAFVSALLYSTPAGGKRREGKVPGHPDLHWTEDEGLLTITRESDGQTVLQAKQTKDGQFQVLPTAAVRRLKEVHALVDPDKLPASDPRSSQRSDEPQVCPEPPLPDAPQGKAKAKAYAAYMKSIVNQPPTEPAFGYWLRNPFANFDVVKYDDCQRSTGTMIEFKGPGYADQLASKPNKAGITMKWGSIRLPGRSRQAEVGPSGGTLQKSLRANSRVNSSTSQITRF